MVVHWSHDKFLFDSDAAAGPNTETVEEIHTSLTKMDSSIDDVPKEIMSGLWEITSRGGSREGLANEIMKHGSNC